MPKGKKGFQKNHKQFGGEETMFKRGHKTNLGKRWKVKDTSNMKKPRSSPNNIGKKPMPESAKEKVRNKLRGRNVGKNGSNWKGGVSKLNKIIRDRSEYRQWVSFCMTRDNWVCQTCGQVGGKLQVHHKKAFAIILREKNIKTIEEALQCRELFDIKNGVTLCLDCHKQTDTYLNNLIKKEVKK